MGVMPISEGRNVLYYTPGFRVNCIKRNVNASSQYISRRDLTLEVQDPDLLAVHFLM